MSDTIRITLSLLRALVVIALMFTSACSGSDSGGTPNTAPSTGDCVIDTSKIGDCKL